MASNKNQHYVPQCYLRQFALSDTPSAINLFNVDREIIVNSASLKKQCSKSYFYGDNLELEKALQPIEGLYAEIVREIKRPNYQLTNEHRQFLLFFWCLQYMRTEAASRRSIEMTDGMGEVAGLEPKEFKLEMKEAVQLAMKNFVKSRLAVNDLRVCLIKNKSDVDFVTSDDPAVLTNKWHFLDKRTFGSNFGLGSAGVIALLPITPRILCIGFDSDVYSIPHHKGWVEVKSRREINIFNEHQYLNSRANIFYQDRRSEAHIITSFRLAKNRRLKARHKFNYAILDEENTRHKRFKVVDWRTAEKHQSAIIHTEMIHPTPSAWPATIRWKRKGVVYTNGSGVGFIRESMIDPAIEREFTKEFAR